MRLEIDKRTTNRSERRGRGKQGRWKGYKRERAILRDMLKLLGVKRDDCGSIA